MSYSITLRIYQRNPDRGHFHITEKTVWYYGNGGTWSDADGVLKLTIGQSGTSGVLRFQSDKSGELLTVAVGVHNYKRWTDIVPNLAAEQTALKINGEYYNNGGRDSVREQQLSEYNVTSAKGTKVEVKFTVTDGNDLQANVIIG